MLDHFTDNAFNFFTDVPILAAADSAGKGYNAMTISWGDAGIFPCISGRA